MHRDQLYIDGAWVDSTGTDTIEVIDPSTEEVIGSIPAGTEADVDAAVAAARRAFDDWAAQDLDARVKYVQAIAEGLAARGEEIADLISREVGMPKKLSQRIQAGLPAGSTASVVEIAKTFPWEEQIGNSLIVREPVGVVGAITPWNYPLHQIMAKVAPALVAGNTVVLKPSEVAPLNAFVLAEILDEVGLPAGVFNLVTGDGPVVGEAISRHPDVDMVSLTGSTRAGRAVSEAAAGTIKRVHLELGGKSANVILDDADLQQAVGGGMMGCYLNSGQTCTALTRMLVPKDRMDEAKAIAAAAAEQIGVGAPEDEGAMLGPLVSEAQWNRVQGFIQQGIDEGAELVTGGTGKPEGREQGYFVKPTVFADVDNSMTVAREEIFGPVLSIIGYDDEEDAIRIANDTPYGLSGAVSSADPERAKRVARRLRTGQVAVNGGSFNLVAPFGGYKQSGNGRELGAHGLAEFTETKAIQL
ncbi:MAG: aldehyde dehydrogenase family protein [Actinomycetota bacterium]